MILLCKLAAAVFVAAVLMLILKKDQPAFAFLVSVCTAAGLLAVVVRQLQPLLDWLRTLDGYFQGQSPAALLQALGIAGWFLQKAELYMLAALVFCQWKGSL